MKDGSIPEMVFNSERGSEVGLKERAERRRESGGQRVQFFSRVQSKQYNCRYRDRSAEYRLMLRL